MKNPWCTVPLKDYEAHMGLDAVAQLQALNRLMKSQFEAYPAKRIAVLGVAGGNGLEHIPPGTEKIYAIDVNRDYLNVCSERFQTSMGNRLELIELDLTEKAAGLPAVDLVVADLLIEYVGIDCFCRKVAAANPERISCVIQNNNRASFVSNSPYEKVLKAIGELHQDVDSKVLLRELQKQGYALILSEATGLPNGKQLHRMDFTREERER